jgi:putative ATPase
VPWTLTFSPVRWRRTCAASTRAATAFYDQISALHKSVRGSDPDASLYWLVRMLDGGADPLYLGRRIVRMAAEDIGLADPRALQIALNAVETYERLGSPEGELALAEAVIFMACAAKSNAVYVAYNAARKFVGEDGSREVPVHLRQRADEADEGTRLRTRIPLRARRAGGLRGGRGLLPGRHAEGELVPADGRGLEAQIAEKLAHLRELDKKHGKN